MSKSDCGFTTAEGWFRYRACAIIINDGNILMAKNEREPYYYSVGGGVHLHESAEDAVVREVFEETGVRYEVNRLAFIHENFFVGDMTDKNQQCHEIALYFLMKPNATKVFDHVSSTIGGLTEPGYGLRSVRRLSHLCEINSCRRLADCCPSASSSKPPITGFAYGTQCSTFGGIKEQVVWIPINRLYEFVVYPSFFKEKLLSLCKGIEHIVTHE